jgi:proteasome accessory factor A
MAERLLGVETEYAISAMQGREPVERVPVIRRLMELAHATLPNVQDGSSSGLFMENGARLYLDCGMHVEFSTPECANPWDAVRYVEAGHQTMLRLLERLAGYCAPGLEANCYRVNVDYGGNGATWGCHESYMHRMSPALMPAQLIPHLVTRVVYAGAGGFHPFSSGLEFTLSPRAAHMERAISSDSTNERGIFHTKDEPLCAGYHRLHVLCGESLCSQLAMFVKFGATSLIVAMAEAGLTPGNAVQLASPLDALRTVAGDLTLKRPLDLKGSARGTAIEIQRHYLEMAEAHRSDSFMPLWAPEVCTQWRRVLDLLDRGPAAAAGALDWPTKLALYMSHAERRGLNWNRLRFWNALLERMRKAIGLAADGGRFPLEQAIGPETPIPDLVKRLSALLSRRGLEWDELRKMLVLRPEFFEIDMRFGQLGARGLFSMMDEAGALHHRVSGIDNIEHAMRNPPATGRAKLRGAVVKRVAGDGHGGWCCTWQRIYSQRYGRLLDLSDPFAKEELWQDEAVEESASVF